jgi:hypothetical protein
MLRVIGDGSRWRSLLARTAAQQAGAREVSVSARSLSVTTELVGVPSSRGTDEALAVQSPSGADCAPADHPANDVVPPGRCGARSGSRSDAVVVDLGRGRLTPDQIEAIAQRLAAVLLRGP